MTHPEENARPALSLAELYRAHAQDVARWAHRLGGPLLDVEDAVQEVFVVAHRQLPAFRGDAHPRTWLFRIAENVVRHRRRKDRLRAWLTGGAETAAAEREDEGPDAHATLEERERARRLHRVLDRMSERSRRVLVLFELEGWSGEQIAQTYGARIGTVWVWLHRARAEFVKRMNALIESEGE